ncbi:MAG: hypothetical protein Q8P41_29415 [Pseudomonadota bacterium]|nr:hypothetical protein [Pseudomonadota bacterium]
MAPHGPILLLGRCGLARLVEPLQARTGAEVVVAGWTQVELVERLRPALVYVDLYDWDRLAPLVSAAVAGVPVALDPRDLAGMRAVVAALRGHPVVYRGLRRPLGDAFGPAAAAPPDLVDALDVLDGVTRGERVIDVAALWARHGIVPDEVDHGLGHGEATLGGRDAALLEARALHALWHARVRGPVKCVVVDLDDTLVHGRVTDDDFARKNPAWQPADEAPGAPLIEGWWRLRRGLHEALRVMQRRGIVLALATRNDPAVVARRFRKRAPVPDGEGGMYAFLYDDLPGTEAAAAFAAHPAVLDRVALGPDDFVHVEAGFGAKSDMCRAIAEALGIGLDTLAFLDDAAFERAEVARNAPEVYVLDRPVEAFRDALLHEAPFVTWEAGGVRRAASYRSRAAVVRAARADGGGDLEAFLHDLAIRVTVRPATAADLPRVRELLQRAHQLDLTGERPVIEGPAGVWVASCRDRLADHGLVSVGVVRDRRLVAWVCSCRVLPHRVAGSILAWMRAESPGVAAARVPTAWNAATIGLLEEGPAAWVTRGSPDPGEREVG